MDKNPEWLALQNVAIEDHGVSKSDIKSIEISTRTVTLNNHRKIFIK